MDYNSISIAEATALQKELRTRTILHKKKDGKVRTIAGADISFNKYETDVYAGIIVLQLPELHPVAYSLAKAQIRFPYVPGYLAFREIPALIRAWEGLPQKPDVLIVDGHGIAHPRRMGIATHFGILASQPAIGCAKNILCGKYEEPENVRGAFTLIRDKTEVVGAALRSRPGVKPIFVSPGHLVSLDDSLDIVQQCLGKYRIPEPTRRAHEMVNNFRKGTVQEGFALLEGA